jgi:glycosyltransferase involved in cell wall biosynthesis
MKNISVAIVIPAFNEEMTIAEVVHRASLFGVPLVVDDGSIDETVKLAQKNGAIVVKNSINLGYEKTLSKGLDKAKALGFTHAITMDADGQHDANTLKKFIEKIELDIELVIGVRDKFQRAGEWLFSVVGKALWGVQDPLCGMKAYKLSLLEEHGPFDTTKSAGAEFAIKLVSNGVPFSEVSVPTVARLDESRYGAGFSVNFRLILSLVRLVRIKKCNMNKNS